MITSIGGWALGPGTVRQMAEAEKVERAEIQAAEDHADQCEAYARTHAWEVVVANEAARAASEAEAHRAEAQERRAAEERAERAENYRIQAIMNGGRYRTIGEILQTAAGIPGP